MLLTGMSLMIIFGVALVIVLYVAISLLFTIYVRRSISTSSGLSAMGAMERRSFT